MPRRRKPKPAHRVLDLSAAQAADPASTAPKPLTDRQLADYKATLLSLKGWLTRQRRANTKVAKLQKKLSVFEKQLTVFPIR
jgi:hypothetical protein